MGNYIKSMKGYKATNSDMKCRDHKFELGKWYEISGEIEPCKRGFHFCLVPSGVYAFYDDPGTRIFEVEAEDILQTPPEPGADSKMVARRIRLVKEITPGYRGTDKPNDGNLNTGDRNTGNRNTGNLNTGNWNTGNLNTGNWNTTDRSSGFFCAVQPKVMSFDVQTDLTYEEFLEKYPQAYRLGEALTGEDKIRFDDFKMIPGITEAKLKKLHAAHLARRKKS